ncbi:MAG: hypothetical protein KKD94_06465 [Nanoarchaeota archaeon]|nr:hypothetical protein [Nanoarchaeota archaeon]
MKCPSCNHKSSKVNIRITEIGTVLWLDSKIIDGEAVLGETQEYEGGFTDEQKPMEIICKECGEVINEINDD